MFKGNESAGFVNHNYTDIISNIWLCDLDFYTVILSLTNDWRFLSMRDIIDESYKEQINLYYFAHMPRVAHDLFARGLKTSKVASDLLITQEKAERLRKLYDKGELTETSVAPNCDNFDKLPFAEVSDQYHWKDFAYEVKCAAKLFFDMWLSVRAIACYLRVSEETIYTWRRLYKQNKFKIDMPKGMRSDVKHQE